MSAAGRSAALALALGTLGMSAAGLRAATPPVQTPARPATAKQTPPPPQPPKEVHFPPFEQKTLGNGLRVVVIAQHEVPAVGIQLLVPAGRVYEPAAKAGLAQATAELLRQGTASRSAQQIAAAIDEVGGELSTTGALDSAYADAQVTADQLDRGLDLVADVVLHPSFPAEEVERWRNQTLNGLRIRQQDARYLADAAFDRTVFGEHPYGLPPDGTPESVRAVTRDDLVAFHRAHYLPERAILAVVGDVQPADAFARVERAFGGWGRGEPAQAPPLAAPQRDKPRVIVVDKPDAVQTEIRVGHIGLAFTDPDHFVSAVYNSVLGQSASSRLYEEVRRKRGLSYGAGSSFLRAAQPGWFKASTFTKTESSVEALEVMLGVLRELAQQPVPPGELAERKTYLIGAFPLEIETPAGIAAKVIEALKYGYDRKWLESYRDRLGAVTAEQVQSFAARRIHPESALIVLVGNAAKFRADLEKKYGAVEVIPVADLDLLRPDLRKPAAAPKK